MAKCPNCGLDTERTIDWACKWCGYPLLSGSYKKVPKTYQQLVEEKLSNIRPLEIENKETPIEPRHVPLPLAGPKEAIAPKAEPVPEPAVETEPEEEDRLVAEREIGPDLEEKAEPLTRPEVRPELEKKAEPLTRPEVRQVLPLVETTVAALVSAFNSDGAAAHDRFKNKQLKVTGKLGRVVMNSLNNNYFVILVVDGEDEFWDIKCTFSGKYLPELQQLKAEQTVTVQGEYAGYVTEILLRDCVLKAS